MRIERAAAVLAACATLAGGAGPARAQDPLTRIGAHTQVGSISFRFLDHQSLAEDELRQRIALTGRGSLVGLRKLFGFLPFVPPVGQHPFDPLELQRDVIRLERYYQRAGFPKADVSHQVTYDAKADQVAVAYVVREGPPLMLRALTFTGDSGALSLPPEVAPRWARFQADPPGRPARVGETERRAIGDTTVRWFRHVGYPFATAEVTAAVDSAATEADVTVRVSPGERRRIREIEVAGNPHVPAEQLTRVLPVGPGDWYDGPALEEGRRQLSQLDLVRFASIEVPRDSADDSTVVVRLRVAENPAHLIRGETGVNSGGGVTAQGQWTNRSFLGGVRTLTVAGTAQTGVLPFGEEPQRLYRLEVTLHQPFIGDRRISAAGGPFAEYRDDVRGRSRALGFEGTLVYATGPLRSLSLGYSLSRRRVLSYGLGGNLQPSQYLPILHLADSASAGVLEASQNRSVVSLEGSYGRLDQFANPRRGYVVRPRVEVTTPGGLNTVEYVQLSLTGTAYLPITRRIGLTLRAGGGRIFPYGRSLAGVGRESPFVSLLRLRDVTFTTGGSRDVRGWGSELLGPKLPEVRQEATDSGVRTFADRYTPLGGLARLTSSLELQLPLPGFGEKWRSFVFSDGGRIWTPDSRFNPGGGALTDDAFFTSVGAGVGYTTVVGAIQIALAYKLNASPLDLRSPDAVLAALAAGRPIDSVPEEGRRRFHLHFSIGSTF
jgi:outer membrane protein insertion porin family